MERLFSSSARMIPRAGVRPAYGTVRNAYPDGPLAGASCEDGTVGDRPPAWKTEGIFQKASSCVTLRETARFMSSVIIDSDRHDT
ncbi:hypothetical protein BJ956_001968 [Arthrobacter psychrochitiniphilus]|nr:hypothetical protein [Arthrobacter psychrochitiniphilus]